MWHTHTRARVYVLLLLPQPPSSQSPAVATARPPAESGALEAAAAGTRPQAVRPPSCGSRFSLPLGTGRGEAQEEHSCIGMQTEIVCEAARQQVLPGERKGRDRQSRELRYGGGDPEKEGPGLDREGREDVKVL